MLLVLVLVFYVCYSAFCPQLSIAEDSGCCQDWLLQLCFVHSCLIDGASLSLSC